MVGDVGGRVGEVEVLSEEVGPWEGVGGSVGGC